MLSRAYVYTAWLTSVSTHDSLVQTTAANAMANNSGVLLTLLIMASHGHTIYGRVAGTSISLTTESRAVDTNNTIISDTMITTKSGLLSDQTNPEEKSVVNNGTKSRRISTGIGSINSKRKLFTNTGSNVNSLNSKIIKERNGITNNEINIFDGVIEDNKNKSGKIVISQIEFSQNRNNLNYEILSGVIRHKREKETNVGKNPDVVSQASGNKKRVRREKITEDVNEAIKNRDSDDVNKAPNDINVMSNDVNITYNDVNITYNDVNKASDNVNEEPNDMNKAPNDEAPSNVNKQPNDEAPSNVTKEPSDVNKEPKKLITEPNDMNITSNDENKVSDNVSVMSNDVNIRPNYDDENKQPNHVNKVPNKVNEPSGDVNKPSNDINKPSDDEKKTFNVVSNVNMASNDANKVSNGVNKPSNGVKLVPMDLNQVHKGMNKAFTDVKIVINKVGKASNAKKVSNEKTKASNDMYNEFISKLTMYDNEYWYYDDETFDIETLYNNEDVVVEKFTTPFACVVPMALEYVCASDGKRYANEYIMKCIQHDNPGLNLRKVPQKGAVFDDWFWDVECYDQAELATLKPPTVATGNWGPDEDDKRGRNALERPPL